MTVTEHKNKDLNADSFVISNEDIDFWTQYYHLRRMCRKQEGTDWVDKDQFFISIWGTALKNNTHDINKALPNQPHRINGRNMRTATSTAANACSPSKKEKMMRLHYSCSTAEETRMGQNTVLLIQEMQVAKEAALENLEKICQFSPNAIFPTVEEVEDVLVEELGGKIGKMDQKVYESIHDIWRRRNIDKMAKHLQF